MSSIEDHQMARAFKRGFGLHIMTRSTSQVQRASDESPLLSLEAFVEETFEVSTWPVSSRPCTP